ncbi:uncharacterized protein LOC130671223 [Microplitis mediator]|uniref:uncharacterized protein LOC130671223 n=1 Tax=Microplitis mediator TaxID=375433 RepID=UPI002554DC5D|nr:uncharacterized protein LOC130671223 [Microplitis mediator]
MAAEAQVALQMQRIDAMRNMSTRLTDAIFATQGAPAIDAELTILESSRTLVKKGCLHDRLEMLTQSLSIDLLLATALVKLNSLSGSTCTARVLIDQGSELSFVTHSLIKKLDIPLNKAAIPLRGIGNVSAGHSLGSCQVSLHSLHSSASITIQAHVLALLTVNLPSFTLTNKKWPHIKGLQLADPDFLTSRPIDIILGAAPAAHIINAKIRKGNDNDPIAQSTTLGWIIYGSVDTATSKLTAYGHHVTVDDQLQDLLSKFWYQEEPQTEFAIHYNEDEEKCEQHFVNTHYRQTDGRYVVRLPLKSSPSQLGDSLRAAQYALLRLRKRLDKDRIYKKLYYDFLKEYEDLGHMRRVKLKDLPPNSYMLPHHGVLKEQSTTTKLRVVFNGSWKTTSGVSINEILHVGPKIQVDISDVLIRIRCHRYLFATDVTKMFRQIAVDKEDHHLQCILWFDEEDLPTVFALATVTYGTTSAPYLAGRALLQLAEDEGNKFPKAVEPLTNTRYVDDIYGGADELAEAIQVALDTKNMCAAGCFPLAKWASNSTELLSQVAPVETQEDTPRELGDTTVKVLGLTWNSTQDKFQFGYSLPEASPTTKRTILSEIARLLDPLGFLAPIIVRAKMFMQKLWLQNFDWDATLSPLLLQEWNLFRDELHQISKIQIPRWNHVRTGVSIELHGFSDASQLAMAAVVYLKVTDATGSSNISLVCAKTQVAPLKPISIPRMELNAAVLLAQLVLYVKKVLKLENVPIFMWTDSAVSLTWIRNNPARWKVYIRNRVTKIQESLPSVNWDFVPGKLNPADCASRGLTAAKLEQHSLWWTGPKWLSQSKENWPSFDIPTQTVSHLEERPGLVFTIYKADSHPLHTLLDKFSKLSPLLRTLGICLRAIAKFKKVPQSTLATPLSTVDLELAKTLLIKYTQSQYYSQELKLLKDGDSLHRNHRLAKLIPYVDYNGVLRVGGRLKNSLLDDDKKNPAILPRSSRLSTLLIEHSHQKTFHGGTQLTLADLRRSVWIEGGRVPVRSHILRCVVCTRHRGVRAQQLMGQLPSARVRPSKAFLHTGIDYAGPVTRKTFQGRGAKTYKGWIAVFVCLATSAIHIEIVTDYSTDAFVAAFRRFTSRRGACSTLYSDCGTNFVGADATLKREFAAGSKQLRELQYLFATDGTDWKFNPPSAPHFGGKWEAAVKSIKFHLIRTIGESLLTYDQLATVLTQIEAVLNSRPIAPLSEDPADLTALTPGHFLIGEPLIAVPGPSLLENNTATLSRWQQLQQMFQSFWTRWSSEYLQRHQSISKWHHPSNIIKVGSLVLLTDERFPPSKWPLARVLALHPGRDGLTRVVTLKTATTELVRPIAKLCVLPVHSPDDNPVDTVASAGENVQSRPNSLPPENAEPHQ